MESGLSIGGGTLNRYLAYDFSCLSLMFPLVLSGLIDICLLLTLSLVNLTQCVFLAPWTKPLEERLSFAIY